MSPRPPRIPQGPTGGVAQVPPERSHHRSSSIFSSRINSPTQSDTTFFSANDCRIDPSHQETPRASRPSAVDETSDSWNTDSQVQKGLGAQTEHLLPLSRRVDSSSSFISATNKPSPTPDPVPPPVWCSTHSFRSVVHMAGSFSRRVPPHLLRSVCIEEN